MQMNQIRDALDDGGALSSGSRRDALTSFSQRHLHGQALWLSHCCALAVSLHAGSVRILELTALHRWRQVAP